MEPSSPPRRQSLVPETDTQRTHPTITTQAASASISCVNSGVNSGGGLGLGGLQPPGQSWETTRTIRLRESVEEEEEIELPPRPSFAPFFTLVHDADREEMTWHPRSIHYIFSDDDASDLLTEALLRSADIDAGAGAESVDVIGEGEEEEEEIEDKEKVVGGNMMTNTTSSSSSSATFKHNSSLRNANATTRSPKPPKTSSSHPKSKKIAAVTVPVQEHSKGKARREERVIIVDMNSKGDAIDSITSLSPHWQILQAELGNAPTWDSGATSTTEEPGGLMLRIEGTTVPQAELDDGRVGLGIETGKEIVGEEDMHVLLEGFDRKMGILRRVLSRGERATDGFGGGEGGEEKDVLVGKEEEKMLLRHDEDKALRRDENKTLFEEQ